MPFQDGLGDASLGSVFGDLGVCFSLTAPESGVIAVTVTQATAVTLIPMVRLAGQPFPLPRNHSAKLSASAGAIASIVAFQRGPVSLVAAIVGMTPVTTILYARLLDNETNHRSQLAGAAIGVAAVILFAAG